MLDSPGEEPADPHSDSASPPPAGPQRRQATVSAQHGYLGFWADEQETPSIELLRERAPGRDGSHVVRVSALEATEILQGKSIWMCICVYSCTQVSLL